MKALLEFDFDDTNKDDRKEFEMMFKAQKMASVIWQFAMNSKKAVEWKLDASNNITNYDAIDLVYAEFFELLETYNVSVEELS